MSKGIIDMLRRVPYVIAFLISLVSVDAQRQVKYAANPNVLPLDDAVRESDLVIRGTLTGSRFVVGEEVVWTEYSLTATRTLFQRGGTPADGRLGAIDAIVFRVGGGTGIVNGELITATDVNYPADSFQIGTEYILLLKHIPHLKSYFPTCGPYSVFRVKDGQIDQLKTPRAETRNLHRMPADKFGQLIRQLTQQR